MSPEGRVIDRTRSQRMERDIQSSAKVELIGSNAKIESIGLSAEVEAGLEQEKRTAHSLRQE